MTGWDEAEQRVRDLVRPAPGRVAVVARAVPGGQGFSVAGDESFTSASLIKVPVLVSALQQVEAGALSLTQRVRVDTSPRVGGSGILAGLSDVTDVSIRDLLELMITISDNLATNLLIETLSVPTIAASIEAAGLTNTALQRRLMDLQARSRGLDNHTCATDMALLLEQIAVGEGLFGSADSYRLAREVLARQQVNDRLPRQLPHGWVLAHKTGELDGVRHDAGFVTVDSSPVLVIAVLTEGFGTGEEPDAYGAAAADLVADVGRIVYSAVGSAGPSAPARRRSAIRSAEYPRDVSS
ncbi:serine hydrolase [Nakamurella lactea]|uniref:serine hydrolase n=1 Tax=Nakamurella lactea TaxID=459515 RepID=UPI0006843654|nr:serine hydrolase [Nakamurella lactea]